MFYILDMDVDQVHDMMDEIAEQQEVAKEIGKFISIIFEKIFNKLSKLFQYITNTGKFLLR